MSALESGQGTTGSSGEFKPKFVEIKGFCDFASSKSEGINRAEAMILLNKLKSQLDPSLQQHVREIQLRGARNYKVRVPITPEYIPEIRNTWNDFLRPLQREAAESNSPDAPRL